MYISLCSNLGMKAQRKIIRMPPTLASEKDADDIKRYLFVTKRAFSSFALDAVKEKISREIGEGETGRG